MATRMVTLEVFKDPIEAQCALEQLEAQGIPALLVDAVGAPVLPGTINAFGRRELLVTEAYVEQARRARQVHMDGAAEEEGQNTAITADPWAGGPFAAHPTSLASSIEKAPLGATAPEQEGTDQEAGASSPEDEWPKATSVRFTRDELAGRAFRVALFGCLLCPGPAHTYALSLLIKSYSTEGELSSAGKLRAYAALVLSLLVLLFMRFAFLAVPNRE
jgi:hypothetical protein